MDFIQAEREGKKRFLYFVQQGAGGPIKIGASYDPPSRIRTLQQNSGIVLTVLGITEEGGTIWELSTHRKFEKSRIHYGWYHPDSGLLDFIDGLEVSAEMIHEALDILGNRK